MPTVVSLFSGAGGFDQGFEEAGFQTVLACEKLADASHTLSSMLGLSIVNVENITDINRDGIILKGDIRDVDFSQIELEPDVLIGGPPCQDFSMAQGNQRVGLNSGRGKLYAEFIRAVMYLQPRIFVFENVPGLISANGGEAYRVIKSDLSHLEEVRQAELGADFRNRDVPEVPIQSYVLLFSGIVDTTSLGVPQTRRRLIIIGMRQDVFAQLEPANSFSLRSQFEEVLSGSGYLFSKFPLTCMEIFEGQPLNQLQDKYHATMNAYADLAEANWIPEAARWRSNTWDKLTFNVIQDYYAACGLRYEDFNEAEFQAAMEEHEALLDELGWLERPVHEIDPEEDAANELPRLTRRVIKRMKYIPPGENYSFVDGVEGLEVAGKNISFIYRRAEPLKPAWTVVAYGGGGTYGYHYARDRAQLTLRERARIQTFRDTVRFAGKGTEVRAQIGEAVPPLMARRIGDLIHSILNEIDEEANEVFST